jgi:predicted nucleic acid-binding Zn ribbon protein
MPRDAHDDQDDLDESEYPDEADMDDDPDGTPPIDCPYCGAEIHADTDVCPKCGKYISREDAPQERGWFWWIALLVVALGAILVLMRLL